MCATLEYAVCTPTHTSAEAREGSMSSVALPISSGEVCSPNWKLAVWARLAASKLSGPRSL